MAEPEGTPVGGVVLGPTPSLEGKAYWAVGDDGRDEIVYFASAGTGTDWATVRCSGSDHDRLADAAASFGGLWSPHDLFETP